MYSATDTIEEAKADFVRMNAHAPYRFGGKWYISKLIEGGFRAYRTKKAAVNNTIENNYWVIDFGK